jgi:hypothetical protein
MNVSVPGRKETRSPSEPPITVMPLLGKETHPEYFGDSANRFFDCARRIPLLSFCNS